LSSPQESGKGVAQTCPAQARDAQRKNALSPGFIGILLKIQTLGELFSSARPEPPLFESRLLGLQALLMMRQPEEEKWSILHKTSDSWSKIPATPTTLAIAFMK
jgi:hypothetical protein